MASNGLTDWNILLLKHCHWQCKIDLFRILVHVHCLQCLQEFVNSCPCPRWEQGSDLNLMIHYLESGRQRSLLEVSGLFLPRLIPKRPPKLSSRFIGRSMAPNSDAEGICAFLLRRLAGLDEHQLAQTVEPISMITFGSSSSLCLILTSYI